MTDFNKLIAADELLKDIQGIPVEVRDDVPPHTLYLIRKDFMVKNINKQDWGFFEFVRHSADYMNGSIHPIKFYLGIPFAWLRFDRKQRKDHE